MDDQREQSNLHDEPVILSFEAFKKAANKPDEQPPEPTNNDHTEGDEFWAGRNLAMRLSARWAA